MKKLIWALCLLVCELHSQTFSDSLKSWTYIGSGYNMEVYVEKIEKRISYFRPQRNSYIFHITDTSSSKSLASIRIELLEYTSVYGDFFIDSTTCYFFAGLADEVASSMLYPNQLCLVEVDLAGGTFSKTIISSGESLPARDNVFMDLSPQKGYLFFAGLRQSTNEDYKVKTELLTFSYNRKEKRFRTKKFPFKEGFEDHRIIDAVIDENETINVLRMRNSTKAERKKQGRTFTYEMLCCRKNLTEAEPVIVMKEGKKYNVDFFNTWTIDHTAALFMYAPLIKGNFESDTVVFSKFDCITRTETVKKYPLTAEMAALVSCKRLKARSPAAVPFFTFARIFETGDGDIYALGEVYYCYKYHPRNYTIKYAYGNNPLLKIKYDIGALLVFRLSEDLIPIFVKEIDRFMDVPYLPGAGENMNYLRRSSLCWMNNDTLNIVFPENETDASTISGKMNNKESAVGSSVFNYKFKSGVAHIAVCPDGKMKKELISSAKSAFDNRLLLFGKIKFLDDYSFLVDDKYKLEISR